LSKEIEKGTIEVDNIDVFCEKGVFSVEQTEKIFEKSRQLCNLHINFHSDELYPLNSVEVIDKILIKILVIHIIQILKKIRWVLSLMQKV
jgi:hypothetical protein